MNFNEFYIGMSIYLLESPDTCGVITKYIGMINGIYYVNVDLGKDLVFEFSLDELNQVKGNI